MASELDNLPDEEIPCRVTPAEVGQVFQQLADEMKEAAREFLEANDPREWAWLKAYLDPESPTYSNATGAVRAAYPGISKTYSFIKSNALVCKHRERIKQWLDECGCSAEVIKLKTRKMFDAVKEGRTEGSIVSDNMAILKALELASKHQGLLSTDKVDLGTIKIEVVNYSDRKDPEDTL